MLFGYSLAQARKAAISLVVLGCAVAGLVISGIDPNFQQAAVLLTGSIFAVVGVFASKNATEDDLAKAVAQLQGNALTVVGYFVTVPTATAGKISLVVGALLGAYAVFRVPNEP